MWDHDVKHTFDVHVAHRCPISTLYFVYLYDSLHMYTYIHIYIIYMYIYNIQEYIYIYTYIYVINTFGSLCIYIYDLYISYENCA